MNNEPKIVKKQRREYKSGVYKRRKHTFLMNCLSTVRENALKKVYVRKSCEENKCVPIVHTISNSTKNTFSMSDAADIVSECDENEMDEMETDEIETNEMEMNLLPTNQTNLAHIPSDRGFTFDIENFVSELTCWAIKFNVNNVQLRGVLELWNKFVPLPQLPKDPRTLLNTPRMIQIFDYPDKKGKYWHNGLKKVLVNTLSAAPIQLPETISLNVHVDGISPFKSSVKTFWPILTNIHEMPQIPPMVVGVYCGPRKSAKFDYSLKRTNI